MILSFLYWDPSPEIFSFNIPLLGRPILWYGFLFALGFFLAYLVLKQLLKEDFREHHSKAESKKRAAVLAERIAFFVIIGCMIGARLGDVLLYQSWQHLVHNPLSIIKVWEGGLASHGGVMGIILALYILSLRLKKEDAKFGFLFLLDRLAVSAPLAGVFIRIGNLFNQEILGKATTLPWAVIFGHPAGGEPVLPRHPVQLYEALYYLFVFILLFSLWKKVPAIRKRGMASGIGLILIFLFRFFIEFLKEEQSLLIGPTSILTMGQYLSLPFILLGLFLIFKAKK